MKKRIKKLEFRIEEREKEHFRKIRMLQRDFYQKMDNLKNGGGG